VNLVNYRGYLIQLRGEALSWRFVAAPAAPDSPILCRGVSPRFTLREEALVEEKRQIDQLLAA